VGGGRLLDGRSTGVLWLVAAGLLSPALVASRLRRQVEARRRSADRPN